MRKFLNHLLVRPNALLLLAFTVTTSPVCAQWSSLSRPVKVWALLHPFSAMKVKKMRDECHLIYDQPQIRQQLDTFSAGGKLDAFRHVFYMAAFARDISSRKIKRLGIAHEKGNYRQFKNNQLEDNEKPDSLASVMDLHNNDLGIALGKQEPDVDLPTLRDLVIGNIREGKALIFKRSASGAYLTCEGEKIDPEKFRDKWYVPKCLVPSDYNYQNQD